MNNELPTRLRALLPPHILAALKEAAGPIPSARHTPVRALHDDKGKLIGYLCMHCRQVTTPSHKPSEPTVFDGHRPRKNKTHGKRLAAARRLRRQIRRGRA